jgi:exodeoxyribonuclease VII small subunit
MPVKKTTKKLNFSKAFEELEGITEWFEGEDQLDLDEGLKKFERGLELASTLKAKLGEVENKVETIKQKFDADL